LADRGQIDLARELEFRLGGLVVQPDHCRVRLATGEVQSLEPRVMQVLIVLAMKRNQVLSRSALRESCWAGRTVGDDALERVIGRIRRLLNEPGAESLALETVPKVGYCLRAPAALPGGAAPVAATGADELDRTTFSDRSRRIFLLGGAALAVAVGGAATVAWRQREKDAEPAPLGPLTVAVLPFTARGGDADLAHFARQLSDEVRADLSRVSGLRVIAETSSRAVAEEGGSARKIGRSLGADLLLEAQVGGGRQPQVLVALVDAAQQLQLWTATIRGSASDLPSLRLQVSGAVIQQVSGLITTAPGAGASPVRRPDPQAYAYVTRANRLLDEIRTSSMRGRRDDALRMGDQAESLARQALAVDSRDSGAWLILAVIARNGWSTEWAARPLTTQQRVAQSVQLVRRALLSDPNQPAALTQLGDYYRRFELRWDEAENLFRRALAIDPNMVEAHWSYGYQLGTTGRALEGLGHALSVFELDPHNPFRRVALPRLLYVLGQRRAAMKRYRVELAEQPDNLFLLRELYLMFIAEGNAPDLDWLAATISRQPDAAGGSSPKAALHRRARAAAAALRGAPAELRDMIDADVADYESPATLLDATPQGRARDDLPYIFAVEYAWAGLADRALDMLDIALAAKSLYWPATLPHGVAPLPPAVANHPRFAGLWRRDPGLLQLVQRRHRALLQGQMAGFGNDGVRRVPTIPAQLANRVRAALLRSA
jgi:DNA-binding winged helix-turn-helix (wHTH) protein/TolB-like protein/tetratricopeptide (TPR) repeat protein